jgi:hypothetical protein
MSLSITKKAQAIYDLTMNERCEAEVQELFSKGLHELMVDLIDELEDLEKRSCQNCDTHPSNCRIFYGASKQLALSTETFNCSLWGPKK